MDSSTFERMFSYYPNTPDQDEDLEEVYRQAKRLATAIRERVDPKFQDQVLMQLSGIVTSCRTAIELNPRQMKPLVLV
jgi:hypothetical protein